MTLEGDRHGHNEGSDLASDKGYIDACSSSDLEEGDLIECETDTKTIVVGRGEGTVYAFDGVCTHDHYELVDGALDGIYLTCPLHFACFHVRDDSVLEGPADDPLQVYEAIETDGSVWITDEGGE